MTARPTPTSVAGALSLANQIHQAEIEFLRARADELQREVLRLQAVIATPGSAVGSVVGQMAPSDGSLKANQMSEGCATDTAVVTQKSASNGADRRSPSSTTAPGRSTVRATQSGQKETQIVPYSSAQDKGVFVSLASSPDSSNASGAYAPPVNKHRSAGTNSEGVQPSYYHGGTIAEVMRSSSIDFGNMTWAQQGAAWKRFVRSGRFDMMVGVVIIINAATIGYDAALRADGTPAPAWMEWCEHFFLTVYLVEFGLRFGVGGKYILCNKWIHLDLMLLACGVADVIVRVGFGSKGGAEFLDNFMVIRILRLARIARVFRLVSAFKTLWVLVNGLFHSLITLLWTFVLIALIMYCFAIFAIEVIKEDPEASDRYNQTVRDHFNNLFVTCLTLLQGVTLDSVGGIYKPVIMENPPLALYFGTFIFLVSIALMNLVTAIMVESALDQSKQDKAANRAKQLEKRKKQVAQLKLMFEQLDTDGSEMLSHAELGEAPAEVKERLLDITGTEDLEELFRLLDYDDDGQVSIDEFCQGVEKFCQGKLELFNLIKISRSCLRHTEEVIHMLRVEQELRVAHRTHHGHHHDQIGHDDNGHHRRPSLEGCLALAVTGHDHNGHHAVRRPSRDSHKIVAQIFEVPEPGDGSVAQVPNLAIPNQASRQFFPTADSGNHTASFGHRVHIASEPDHGLANADVVHTLPSEPANECFDV